MEHSDAICGQREADAYKQGWEDATKYAAWQAKPLLRRDAMDTSRKAVQRNAATIKGTQATVYGLLKNSRNGLTDFELEAMTGIVHQSVSAARRALVVSGLVTDSGERRKNLRGNDAAVWVLSSPSRTEPDEASDQPADRPVCRHCGTTTCARRPGYAYCYGTRPRPDNPGCPRCGAAHYIEDCIWAG